MTYMTINGIKLLLEMPDVATRDGLRDLALLSLMYDTGARVQEIIDLTPSCIRFEHPSTIKLIGKGKKIRIVPLMEKEAQQARELEATLAKVQENLKKREAHQADYQLQMNQLAFSWLMTVQKIY